MIWLLLILYAIAGLWAAYGFGRAIGEEGESKSTVDVIGCLLVGALWPFVITAAIGYHNARRRAEKSA